MTTINALDDGFDEAERGLEWLEKLEALQARSASDQAAWEVAEYVMKLRGRSNRVGGELVRRGITETVSAETAGLVRNCGWKATMTAGTAASARRC